jgi:hypothetical protein
MSTAPPVIVRVPASLGEVEVLVRHEEWGVEADVRPAYSSQSWTPVALMGGEFEVRSQ